MGEKYRIKKTIPINPIKPIIHANSFKILAFGLLFLSYLKK